MGKVFETELLKSCPKNRTPVAPPGTEAVTIQRSEII